MVEKRVTIDERLNSTKLVSKPMRFAAAMQKFMDNALAKAAQSGIEIPAPQQQPTAISPQNEVCPNTNISVTSQREDVNKHSEQVHECELQQSDESEARSESSSDVTEQPSSSTSPDNAELDSFQQKMETLRLEMARLRERKVIERAWAACDEMDGDPEEAAPASQFPTQQTQASPVEANLRMPEVSDDDVTLSTTSTSPLPA